MAAEVVVAGHICLDIIPTLTGRHTSIDKLLIPGRLVQTGKAITATGGVVSNTGLALHLLGLETKLMGKVGDDLLGRAIMDVLRGYGEHLADDMAVHAGEDSSYSIVISPPGLDRIFLHCSGANETYSADDLNYDKLAGARLFHFGYPPLMQRMYADDGKQLSGMFQRVKQRGLITSLDMAMPDPASDGANVDWQAILRAALPFVDVFLPSIEEILLLVRRDVFDDLNSRAGDAGILPLITADLLADVASELLDMGCKMVCLKLGDRGLYLRTASAQRFAAGAQTGSGENPAAMDAAAWGSRELWMPRFEARQVVGTTGAGDCTIAGFLAGLLKGLGPAETLVAAAAVGACNVEAADATSGIIPWAQVQARLASGWANAPMRSPGPGWRSDDAGRIWAGPRDSRGS